MARPRKWPPSILHKKKTNQAFIRVNGKEISLGPFGSPAATAKYLQVIAEIEAGRVPGRTATGLTVADVVQQWRRSEGPRLSERGFEPTNFRLSLRPLLALYGELPCGQLDADRLEVVQLAMAKGSWSANAEPCCRTVVNQRIGRIRRVWKWAERRKLVPVGSWHHLMTLDGLRRGDPRVKHRPKIRAVTFPDLVAVLCELHAKGKTMVRLLYWSGMRPCELRQMKWEEIDRSRPDWIYRPAQHKTDRLGAERAIVFGPRCRSILRSWGKSGGTAGLWMRGAQAPGMAGYVFRHDKSDKPFCASRLACLVGRAAATAGVKCHPYQCRHAAKDRITRAMGLDAARAALGQSSLGTTNSYGNAADLETAIEVARRLA